MGTNKRLALSSVIRFGLLGGLVTVFICLVGIVEISHQRAMIYGVLSMGQTLLLISFAIFCSSAVRRASATTGGTLPGRWQVLAGALTGLLISAALAALVLIGSWIDLRPVFIRASPALFELLTFGLPLVPGVIALLLFGIGLGAAVAGILLLPARIRRAIILGLALIPLVSILASAFFAQRGLTPLVAVLVFVVGFAVSYGWSALEGRVKQRIEGLSPGGRRAYKAGRWAVPIAILLLLPLSGSYPSQVLDLVGLFALMGLGLNIVVGFAGLLDMGYVAFFALGAYTVGILTSPEITWLPFHTGFWGAMPIAVLVGLFAGVILGVPVLGMRGDYLAIVTLGFGEIIRIVALSDWLKPYIGGSNGITRIPRPAIGPLEFSSPGSLYYLILAGVIIAAFVATRLKDSRLGRAWMALREDEDVAQAMGIDLAKTKLLAFATGAAFSGLSGALFATMIGSIYPHSFTLLISINVLAIIIVGGMGSIPGVILGAVVLYGLPELLREFSEYRLLVFGAALVYMMLTRPEGLLPEARRKIELHAAEADVIEDNGVTSAAVAG